MDAKQILIEAKKLIDTPERWLTGVFARTAGGKSVNPLSPDACRFCSIGAVWRIIGYRDGLHEIGLFSAMGGDVYHFNDTHTHGEVMAAFDRAIASA